MKLNAASVERFLKEPSAHIILIYGPDIGLVKERAELLVKKFVDDINDPFNVASLLSSQITHEPSLLYDEMFSQSLMGGQRVVWVKEATDGLKKTLEGLLKEYEGDTVLIIEAGDLGASSSLRKYIEKEKNMAAIPCYKDQAGQLKIVILTHFKEQNLALEKDALFYLQEHLGNDRLQTRQELEKISLYCADKKSVSLEDVQNCTGDHSFLSLEELGFCIAEQKYDEIARIYSRLVAEGTHEVFIVRMVLRHFNRLYEAQMTVSKGVSIAEAVSKLRPPPFFIYRDRFLMHMKKWSLDHIKKALMILYKTEEGCKTSHIPISAFCEKNLFEIAFLINNNQSQSYNFS